MLKLICTEEKSPKKLLEKIREEVIKDGGKGEDLVFRCIPGPEDTREYRKKLKKAAKNYAFESSKNSEQFIVALPLEEAVLYIDEKNTSIEIYEKKNLLETNHEGVYQLPPELKCKKCGIKMDKPERWFCNLYPIEE